MGGNSRRIRGKTTIKVAKLSDGSHLTIDHYDRGCHRHIDLYCPFCEGMVPIYPTKGPVRAHSFRHMPQDDGPIRQCRATPDGELHLAAQIELANGAPFFMPDFCGGNEPMEISLRDTRMEVHYPSPHPDMRSCRIDVEGKAGSGQRNLVEVAVHHFTDDEDALLARGALGSPCAELGLKHLLGTDWTPADIRESLRKGINAKWIRCPVLVKSSGYLKVVCEMHPLGGMAIHFEGVDKNAYHDVMGRLKRVPFVRDGYRRNWHRVEVEDVDAALNAILGGGSASVDVRTGLGRIGIARASVLYDPIRWEPQGHLFPPIVSLRPLRVDPISKRVARATRPRRKQPASHPALDLSEPPSQLSAAA